MSGGVKKIVISNCIFDGTTEEFVSKRHAVGGVVEDIRVDNIVMKNIKEQNYACRYAICQNDG
jgi:polygalacturonase